MSVELAGYGDLALRVASFAALAALLFAPLEQLWPAYEGQRAIGRGRRAAAKDLLFATLGQLGARVLLAFAFGGALAGLDALGLDRPLLAAVPAGALRDGLEVAVGLLLFELGGYGYHRLAHRVPWLWRMHRVHHSSETLDWLASFRQHPLELVLLTLVQNAPLVLLGVPLATHAGVVLLLRLHTVFVHANLRVPEGPWSAVIALPGFHHRHHREDAAGSACNFAALFPFLDRAFGTVAPLELARAQKQ